MSAPSARADPLSASTYATNGVRWIRQAIGNVFTEPPPFGPRADACMPCSLRSPPCLPAIEADGELREHADVPEPASLPPGLTAAGDGA
jgi:hypothetical protein